MKKSNRGWIGLELGHRSIVVAQVERVGGEVRMAAAAEMPRMATLSGDHSTIQDYRDVDKLELKTARLLTQGLTGRAAACVLPMSVTELTHPELPPGEPAEQRAMIANELENETRQQFDFWPSGVIRGAQASALADVNVIAINQARTNAVAEQIMASRMDCRVLDGLPHAVARAVSMAVPGFGSAIVGGLHLGYDNALFVLSREGVPVFVRQLRNGGVRRILTQVSESLGIMEGEAVHVLREFGLPASSPPATETAKVQEVVGEIVMQPLSEIADELKRTFLYISSLGPENVPDSICLLGEGATIRNLPQHLSTKTDLSIWNWNLPCASQPQSTDLPAALLGVAAALSSLAWES